jgi:hypothetical protein
LERAAKALAPVVAVAVVLLASYFAPVQVSGLNLTSCTYTSPIPTVTNVSPNSGTTTGGTTVTITGTQFCNGTVTVMFGTTAGTGVVVNSNTQITVVSPAHAAGTVHVTVTTAGGTSATSTADQYTFVVVPCTSVAASAAPPSPSLVGTVVVITAVASVCPNPTYQFWILAPTATSYALVQAYSTTATFSWNTAGKVGGTYYISVWARDASSAGTFSNSSGSWDAYAVVTYALTPTSPPTPCTALGVTSSPSGTTSVGTMVTFTATATGCPNPSYEFWILQPGSGTWTLGQAYSTSAVFSWATTGQPAGSFAISVRARDASSAGLSSNSSGSWDVYNSSTYVLTTTHPPCTGVSVTSSPSGTALSGTTVTFTATASGCPNPSPVFQFWTLAPGASYQLAQGYSTSPVFNWNTTGKPAGTYYVSVRVRDASSPGTSGNPSGTWDAYSVITYILTVNPCTALSVTSAPSGTALAGTTVIFTATGTCPHASPVYEFWILAPNATTWTLAQAYSTTNTFSWNTAGLVAGTYYVSVRVRDANSPGASSNPSGTWDVYNSSAYTLTTTPCASVSVTSSPSGTAAAGTTVTFTATAMGCPHASPVYEFWILAPGATSWTKVQAYSTTNTFSWVTSGKPAGTYNISVRIRDAQSTGTAGNSSGTWDAYNSSTYTLT